MLTWQIPHLRHGPQIAYLGHEGILDYWSVCCIQWHQQWKWSSLCSRGGRGSGVIFEVERKIGVMATSGVKPKVSPRWEQCHPQARGRSKTLHGVRGGVTSMVRPEGGVMLFKKHEREWCRQCSKGGATYTVKQGEEQCLKWSKEAQWHPRWTKEAEWHLK